ncbi:MAG: ABC transporter ATP-binding protein [Treponema sp.]|jgi:ATP-binding cassette subfamily B protein/ATP-binding cassette subfamily C protein|nr:ABC transporter ATP-binding protein [Treponema sp.]
MLKEYLSIPKQLNQLLDRKRKLYLVALFFMSILLSGIETAGVSIVMPFISVASNPDIVNSGRYKFFYDLFGFDSPNRFIISFGITMIVFYLCRAAYNVFYDYSINKFSLGTFRYFAGRLFKTYLALPYRTYVQKNPSVFANMINVESGHVSQLMLNLLNIFAELFTVCLLYCFLILLNWQITIVLTASLALIIIIVFFTLIRTSKKLGKKRYDANIQLNKIIWETLNNYKFIRLKGNEGEIFRIFDDSASRVTSTSVISQTLSHIPKNVLENFGFSLLVAVICFILWRYNSAAMVIPIVSMYALALYRMLPAINRTLHHINRIAFHMRSLERMYDDMNMETDKEESAPVSLNKSIKCENLLFCYEKGGDVINGISLEIEIGEKVAITGESGGGKTTLVDIIIGMYRPRQGSLFVDDVKIDQANIRSWRRKIGYIPQSIYLFDASVAENVAFGSEPNDEKIIQVLKQAKIWNFLETKEGINTRVGEGGIQLSGGQKQRIGIARALYNDPEVLVLDEATSSLDEETEAQIMDEIYDVSGSRTLIIIAHRLSTIDRCDRKIKIEDGRIV